jgi:hypothetical protein
MSSPKSNEMADAARTNRGLAEQSYGVGLPALKAQLGYIKDAQGGSLKKFVDPAYASQRGGLSDASAYSERASLQQRLAQQKVSGAGGNSLAMLSPSDMGAKLANALTTSRVNQGLGNLEESNKLLQMQLGQTVQAGNSGIAAGSQQLQAASMMPNVDPLYASILGGANAAGAIYGGFNQRSSQPNQSGGSTPPPNEPFANTSWRPA